MSAILFPIALIPAQLAFLLLARTVAASVPFGQGAEHVGNGAAVGAGIAVPLQAHGDLVALGPRDKSNNDAASGLEWLASDAAKWLGQCSHTTPLYQSLCLLGLIRNEADPRSGCQHAVKINLLTGF